MMPRDASAKSHVSAEFATDMYRSGRSEAVFHYFSLTRVYEEKPRKSVRCVRSVRPTAPALLVGPSCKAGADIDAGAGRGAGELNRVPDIVQPTIRPPGIAICAAPARTHPSSAVYGLNCWSPVRQSGEWHERKIEVERFWRKFSRRQASAAGSSAGPVRRPQLAAAKEF